MYLRKWILFSKRNKVRLGFQQALVFYRKQTTFKFPHLCEIEKHLER